MLRDEHLSAARDGKRIKEVLERALELDPGDGRCGLRHRPLPLLRGDCALLPAHDPLAAAAAGRRSRRGPGADGADRRQGQLARGEADYQLHLAYLWYEERFDDALALVLDLQSRYPRNPLFRHLEATIRDVYFHDHARSLAASEALVAAAARGEVNRPGLATVRARLNIALQLDQLGQRDRARLAIDTLLAAQPTAPADAIARARELKRTWSAR